MKEEQVNRKAYKASLSQYGSTDHEEYASTANGFIMGYNEAMRDFAKKFKACKDIPDEIRQIIDKDYWDLL